MRLTLWFISFFLGTVSHCKLSLGFARTGQPAAARVSTANGMALFKHVQTSCSNQQGLFKYCISMKIS